MPMLCPTTLLSCVDALHAQKQPLGCGPFYRSERSTQCLRRKAREVAETPEGCVSVQTFELEKLIAAGWHSAMRSNLV
jgi:hypothetical protein